MIFRGTFGSVVEQVLGSGLGALIGVFLAEAGWRAARRSLPSALRRTADRLSEAPINEQRPAEAAVPSVFGPLDAEVGDGPTRRGNPGVRRPAPVAASPELEIAQPNGDTFTTALPQFGALIIGSGPKAHVRVPGVSSSAAMFQQDGGKLKLVILDRASTAVVGGQPPGDAEVEFPLGQSLELGGMLIRRTV